MARRRLLLLLKPFDVYPTRQSDCLSRITNPRTIPAHFMEWLSLHPRLVGNKFMNKRGKKLWWLATISLLWATIWIERKRRIFEDSQLNWSQEWDNTVFHASWWANKDPAFSSFAVSELCRNWELIKVLGYLEDRCKVHKDAINFCQNILKKKVVDWEPLIRDSLTQPIRNVDLVVTVGGDGTLLQASHFIDDSIPVLGVNSDPTQVEEVEEFSKEFDATRSTGYLCAATIKNFEQVLDNILEDRTTPSDLSRLSVTVNSQQLLTYALNDVLIAHPSPASLSRLSFRVVRDGLPCSPLVNSRSSGLRVSTAAGSTAAMLSAGGFAMPVLSKDLQFMVREPIPILCGVGNSSLKHGLVKCDQSMEIKWFCEKGLVYIDGSHVFHSIQHGDTVEVSSKAPVLRVFLPNHLYL